MSETKSLVLTIQGRNYKVECEAHQADDLSEAADYLIRNLTILGVKGAGDRAYLSIALSASYDYLRAQSARKADIERIQALSRRIDSCLRREE